MEQVDYSVTVEPQFVRVFNIGDLQAEALILSHSPLYTVN